MRVFALLMLALLGACNPRPVVWIYTSLYKDTIEEIEPLLAKHVPEADIRWYQGGSETISARVNAELATGQVRADLVMTSDPFWFEEMRRADQFLPYESPAARDVPLNFKTRDHAFAAARIPLIVLVYNSKTLSSPPESFADLVDPRFRGRIAMPSPLESGSAFTGVAVLSHQLGWDFYRRLRQNGVVSAGGNSSVIHRIETGESDVGIVLLENVLTAMKKGSSVRPVYPREGAVPVLNAVAILKDSRHPEISRKVYDWFYREDVLKATARKGMYGPFDRAPIPDNAIPLSQIHLADWSMELLGSLYDDRQQIKEQFVDIVLGSGAGKEKSAHPVWRAAWVTMALGMATALVSALLGSSFAFLVTRLDIPLRGMLSSLLAVPYALPAYLLGMAWITLANPSNGPLALLFPGGTIYGFFGVLFVESSVAFVFPYLEVKAALERMDASMEEAARMSGASMARTVFSIHLPLLMPAILNGMMFSFLYTISSFGVPALLGMPAREFVLTTWIYSRFKIGGMEGMQEGFILSGVLLSFALAVIALIRYMRWREEKKQLTLQGAKAARPGLMDAGIWAWPVTLGICLFLFVILILPWISLLFSSLAPVAGVYDVRQWTTRNFAGLFALNEFKEALVNSLILAGSVCLLTTVLGFLTAFAAARRQSKRADAVMTAANLLFSMPGTPLALIIVLLSALASSATQRFFETSPMVWLGIAYFVKYFALPASMMAVAFRQTAPALEEAARIAGASFGTVLLKIWLPLLKSTVLAGAVLVFLPMLTEITMSVFLSGPGAATLGTILFQLQNYADQLSAFALSFLLLTAALAIAFASSIRISEVKE